MARIKYLYERKNNRNNGFINHRTIVSILGTTACALLFILRTNLSVAIVAMVNKDTINDYNITAPDLCYHRLNTTDYDSGYKVCIFYNTILTFLNL
jgi:hypothetical protein